MNQEKPRDPRLPPSADPAPMPNPEQTYAIPAVDEVPSGESDNTDVASYDNIEPEATIFKPLSSPPSPSYVVAPRHLPTSSTAVLSSPTASPMPKMPSIPPLSIPPLALSSPSPARQTPSPKVSALDLTKLQSQSALINTLKSWLKTVADALNDRSFTDRLGYKRSDKSEILADGGFIVASRLFVSNYKLYRTLSERNIFFAEEFVGKNIQPYVTSFNLQFFTRETSKIGLQRAAAIVNLLRLLIKNVDSYKMSANKIREKSPRIADSFDKKATQLETKLHEIHNKWSSNASDRTVYYQEYINAFEFDALIQDNDKPSLRDLIITIDTCANELDKITALAENRDNVLLFKDNHLISASNDIDIEDRDQLFMRASKVAGILLARRDYAAKMTLPKRQMPDFAELNKFCEGVTLDMVNDEFILKVTRALKENKIYFSKHLQQQSLRPAGIRSDKFTSVLYNPNLDRDALVDEFIKNDDISYSEASIFLGPLRNGVDKAQHALELPPEIRRSMEPTLEAPVISTKESSSKKRLLGSFFTSPKPSASVATTHVVNPLLSLTLPSHSPTVRPQTVHTAAPTVHAPVEPLYHATGIALAATIDVTPQQVPGIAPLPQAPVEPISVQQNEVELTVQPAKGPKP